MGEYNPVNNIEAIPRHLQLNIPLLHAYFIIYTKMPRS